MDDRKQVFDVAKVVLPANTTSAEAINFTQLKPQVLTG
jgi:hypothetical protein